MIEAVAVNWAAMEPVLPELLLIGVGVLLIGLDLFLPRQRQLLPWLTVVGCLAALFMVLAARPVSAFGGMFFTDGYATVFKAICLGGAILTALMSESYRTVAGMRQGEHYSLMLFSLVGMLVMASAGDLITLYLGLELMALPIYAMVGLHKTDRHQRGRGQVLPARRLCLGPAVVRHVAAVYGLTGTTDLIRPYRRS